MVVNTQKVITALANLIVDVVDVAKNGASIGSLGKVISISSDMKALLSAAPEAFPEMKTFSEQDMIQVGTASYDAIVKVIEHLKVIGIIKQL